VEFVASMRVDDYTSLGDAAVNHLEVAIFTAAPRE
jgi:hypothetical protein